jgi:Family of unknown function (DUF6978)
MLTQAEADSLMAMGKAFVNQVTIKISPGTDETHELIGDDGREQFLLDLWRSTFRVSKVRFQNRARKVIVLARLELDGPPHTNPDGQRITGPHLHVYREGYEDKWAAPLDPTQFRDPSNLRQAFDDFCRFCSIHDVPQFQEELL